jgi:hypothetical protein
MMGELKYSPSTRFRAFGSMLGWTEVPHGRWCLATEAGEPMMMDGRTVSQPLYFDSEEAARAFLEKLTWVTTSLTATP